LEDGIMTERQFISATFASFFVPLIFSIPFWPRLLERYTLGGIFGAFLSFGGTLFSIMAIFGVTTSQTEDAHGPVFYGLLFLAVLFIIVGLFWLKTSKHPVSERLFRVVDLAIQGRWDLLEQAGVPKHEIEQLQRLTPQQRADLLMLIKKQVDEALEENKENRKNKSVRRKDISIFPGSLCDDLECRV
jgi:Na+/melibiose symporter-like transporter